MDVMAFTGIFASAKNECECETLEVFFFLEKKKIYILGLFLCCFFSFLRFSWVLLVCSYDLVPSFLRFSWALLVCSYDLVPSFLRFSWVLLVYCHFV